MGGLWLKMQLLAIGHERDWSTRHRLHKTAQLLQRNYDGSRNAWSTVASIRHRVIGFTGDSMKPRER
jgi:hypothetical protein